MATRRTVNLGIDGAPPLAVAGQPTGATGCPTCRSASTLTGPRLSRPRTASWRPRGRRTRRGAGRGSGRSPVPPCWPSCRNWAATPASTWPPSSGWRPAPATAARAPQHLGWTRRCPGGAVHGRLGSDPQQSSPPSLQPVAARRRQAAHGGADRRPAQVAGPLQCPVHAPDLLGPDHGLALGARTQLRSLPNSLVMREFGPVTPGQMRQRVHKSRAIGDSGRLGLGSGSRGSSEVCCSRPARAAESGRPAARHTISAGAGPLTGEVGKRVPGRGWRRFGGWPGGSGRC